MATTTELGDAFRDQVVGLLRVAGYDVTSEVIVNHKKVDIRFEEVVLGRRRRYALEAKNYAEPLTKDGLVHIVVDYEPLLKSQEIDELLIVSPHRVRSAAANTYLEQNRLVTHRSFYDFQEDVMGFSGYLNRLTQTHDEEGLSEYYIFPTLTDGRALHDVINDWLAEPGADPIAILAGYGMGKTSFVREFGYQLAKRALDGEPSRIPIVLTLGSVSREQSLEGLVASALVDRASLVKRYSFESFAALNKLGRFLCFLDGFDEMKHMMSASEFRHNFAELNRLASGNAKLILLGRPTAFLSDDEKQYVLRGRRPLGDQWVTTPGAPQYEELRLAPFSPSQTNQFIVRYLKYWGKRHLGTATESASSDFIDRRQRDIREAEYGDLMSRPVHAKMLAEIATDPNVDLRRISRYTLYDEFIRLLVEREATKLGRRHSFTSEERRVFGIELAWQLWTDISGQIMGCRVEDLPDSLFSRFLGDGSHDLQEIKRDLVSGSFLEEKTGGVFYIPHRSFQEFLVAEHLAQGIDAEFLVEHHRAFNSEIVGFLSERKDSGPLRSIFDALLGLQGQLSIEFLHSFEGCALVGDWIEESNNAISPWHVLLGFFGTPGYAKEPVSRVVEKLRVLGYRTKTVSGLLTSIFCLATRFEAEQEASAQETLAQAIMKMIAGQLSVDRLKWESGRPPRMILNIDDQAGKLIGIFSSAIKRAKQDRGQALFIEINPRELYRSVRKFLSPRYVLEDTADAAPVTSAVPDVPIRLNFVRALEITPKTSPVAKARIDRLREYFIAEPAIVVRESRHPISSQH